MDHVCFVILFIVMYDICVYIQHVHYPTVLLAVIEHVRDGCTVRAFLLPDFIYITLMLSGVKVKYIRM